MELIISYFLYLAFYPHNGIPISNLKKLQKFTPESAKRTTILTVFLAGIITTTALQKLSET